MNFPHPTQSALNFTYEQEHVREQVWPFPQHTPSDLNIKGQNLVWDWGEIEAKKRLKNREQNFYVPWTWSNEWSSWQTKKKRVLFGGFSPGFSNKMKKWQNLGLWRENKKRSMWVLATVGEEGIPALPPPDEWSSSQARTSVWPLKTRSSLNFALAMSSSNRLQPLYSVG